jgi:hypothetical protein
MKKILRFHLLLSPAIALLMLTNCTEDVKVASPTTEAAIEEVSSPAEESAMSLTIDGVHTIIESVEKCKDCAYVVPANATVVDGKEIGIKPGQAICLDENFTYNNLRIINVEGTEKQPITIAYAMKTGAGKVQE